jgi:hypothetical protein
MKVARQIAALGLLLGLACSVPWGTVRLARADEVVTPRDDTGSANICATAIDGSSPGDPSAPGDPVTLGG